MATRIESNHKRYNTSQSSQKSGGTHDTGTSSFDAAGLRPAAANLQQHRSKERKSKAPWKKLLWVKQSYPDNYTDELTFLDHLQRNPRIQPYEFWPLVADASVIVQQVCTVVVFVCCFSCILQERVSPITMVSWGTGATILGWVLWDIWVGREEYQKPSARTTDVKEKSVVNEHRDKEELQIGLGLSMTSNTPSTTAEGASSRWLGISTPEPLHVSTTIPTSDAQGATKNSNPRLSHRNRQRIATAKSAVLIYCALLGLSPILKSLTMSTASDSIWAISFWLMCINVFFFDYSGGISATFPASLSTNAALMASTVLASRLPSTTHVFSLTLFSIEVFGLFPVFRRYLRLVSFNGHLGLTVCLVMGAGGSVSICTSRGGWMTALVGVTLGSILTALAMGLCSWWLIGLQQYKNEIHGPWDPARPIIRRQWD